MSSTNEIEAIPWYLVTNRQGDKTYTVGTFPTLPQAIDYYHTINASHPRRKFKIQQSTTVTVQE
jgi:hypothetical protein